MGATILTVNLTTVMLIIGDTLHVACNLEQAACNLAVPAACPESFLYTAVIMATTQSLPAKPHQPRTISFPKRSFGKTRVVQVAFKATWFDKWTWIHYDESTDNAFCHICTKAEEEGKLKAKSKDLAFLQRGFSNWKDATDSFRRHEQSKCHKDAVQVMLTLPSTTRDIGESLSSAHSKNKAEARKVLLKILQNIRFLGRQGLPFRGHEDAESNFIQLVKLREIDNPVLKSWMKRSGDRYLSPEIQNEMLSLMSLSILRSIAQSLQSTDAFTIMADECVDLSNAEQLTICFRWVDSDLEVHEEFAGLYQIPDITADTIVHVLKDCLTRMNLQWSRCRGQCYDGAANMSGHRSGVSTQILSLEPRALYTHCYGHSLNLAMCDTIKKCKLTRDTMDTTHEISKLVKFSPKRNAAFDKIKQELSPNTPGFRVLCPTRWTVRAKSLHSIIDNYAVLQQLWESVLQESLDTEVRARVIGVQAQMRSFDYFFGVCVAELVLDHGDNLSATLQSSTISAAEGQHVAALSVQTLKSLRTDDFCELFWSTVLRKADAFDVEEPRLPRRRKRPQRYETGDASPHFPATVEDHYRQIYNEVLDLAISTITSRFDQPGYALYRRSEDLLIKSVRGEDASSELDAVVTFYGDDFDRYRLESQLQTLAAQFQENPDRSKLLLRDIVNYLKTHTAAERVIFSEVVTLVKIVLVNPATNAVSERTFSAMRRLKTYLRSTMLQKRLNAVMVLHVHKERTDSLSMVDLANQFVCNEHRMSVFGTFTDKDL